MESPRLSVIVIARNEEATIGRCLASARFAGEIIVYDHDSSDETASIARRSGAKVITASDWPGFGPQKNRALAEAVGEWVLSLDADEWIEPPLAAEIEAAVASPSSFVGFEMPRRSRFCGRIVRYSGWSPDFVLRLFRRDAGRFSDDLVHEKVLVNGQVGRLKEPIEHDSIADLADAHEKIGLHAAAAATQLIAAGKTSSIGKAIARSLWAFVNAYVVRRGFLDGSVGAMVAAYNAGYTYQKWARVAVLSRGRAHDESRKG